MKGSGELGVDLDQALKSLGAGGARGAETGLDGKGLARGEEGAEGFLAALLETPALQKAGLSEEELASLLEGMTDGEGLPEGGKGVPKELLALLAALGTGELSAEDAAGELDANALLDSAGLDGAKLDTEAARDVQQADRLELLQALNELEAKGLDPEEWVEALHQRLGEAALAEEEETGPDDIAEVAAAGAAVLLGALDGAEADGEGNSLRRGGVGDQIAREMRAAGLLAPGATVTSMSAGASGGETMAGSGGGTERHTAPETLLQALQSDASGSAERSQGGRGDFAATLAAAGAGGNPGDVRVGSMQFSIQQPAQQPGFGQAVGERVTWMINENVQQARLQLNPPGLGPMDVKVIIGDERTTVNFNAHTAAGREALESDLPRLREMLAEQGYEDVDVNVSQGEGGDEGEDEADPEREAAQDAEGAGGARAEREGLGLVDQYA